MELSNGLRHKSQIASRRAGAHHGVVELLGDWVPRLIVFHVAVVGVVGAVADAPAVVGHQDGAVHDVAHQVVQRLVVAEALVPAACTHHERACQRTTHHAELEELKSCARCTEQVPAAHREHDRLVAACQS